RETWPTSAASREDLTSRRARRYSSASAWPSPTATPSTLSRRASCGVVGEVGWPRPCRRCLAAGHGAPRRPAPDPTVPLPTARLGVVGAAPDETKRAPPETPTTGWRPPEI